MKKYSFLLMMALSAVIVACDNKDASKEDVAPDLAMFNLSGPVKEVNIETSTDSGNRSFQIMKFDEQGRLILISAEAGDIEDGAYEISYDTDPNGVVTNHDGQPVKRDEQGRILWLGINGGCSGEQGWHFEYAAEGLKVWNEDIGECWMTPIYEVKSWNEQGLPVEVISQSGDEEGVTSCEFTRNYTEFDDAGNWIECRMSVKCKDASFDEDGNEVVSEDAASESQDYRTIEYYE